MANFDRPDEEDLSELLDVLSREQLAELLLSAASSDPSTTRSSIHRAADADPSHRELFVTGFEADVGAGPMTDSLRRCFSPFGEFERVHIPVDENDRPHGYAFVLFCHLASAKKALKQPRKPVDDDGGRKTVFCSHTRSARKIYVRNLPPHHLFGGLARLSDFFRQYGEIEEVRQILDLSTGQPQAVYFLYRTLEGAMRAFREPRKNFDGRVIVCEKEEFGSRDLPQPPPNTGATASPNAYYDPGIGGGGYGGFNYPNAGAMGAGYSVYYAPGMGGVDLGGSASSVQPPPHAAGTGVYLGGGAAGSYQHGPTGDGFSQHKDLS